MEKVSFKVDGMSCGHCKATVEKGLGQIKGVSQVDVDLASKQVTVVHDGSVTLDTLKKTVDDLGYTAL